MTERPGAGAAAGRTGVAERLRVLRIIVFALILGVALFGGLGAWLVASGTFGDAEPILPMAGVAAAVAALLLVAPVVSARLREPPPGAGRDAVLERFQTGTIVGMALREGAGLLGGIFALLAGELAWLLALVGAAVVTMILAWPRQDELEERLRRASS